MKFHEIKGVDKTICTKEQKLAYLMIFADYEWASKIRMDLNNYLYEVGKRIMSDKRLMEEYDVDATIHCLRNGCLSFAKRECHILGSYEEIGKAFPTLYDVYTGMGKK